MSIKIKNRPDNIFFSCESYSITVIAYKLEPKRIISPYHSNLGNKQMTEEKKEENENEEKVFTAGLHRLQVNYPDCVMETIARG